MTEEASRGKNQGKNPMQTEGENQGKNPMQTEGENQGKNPMQTEYERRRSVWRYVHNLPGPQLPPCEADALWLDGERSLTDVSGSRDE